MSSIPSVAHTPSFCVEGVGPTNGYRDTQSGRCGFQVMHLYRVLKGVEVPSSEREIYLAGFLAKSYIARYLGIGETLGLIAKMPLPSRHYALTRRGREVLEELTLMIKGRLPPTLCPTCGRPVMPDDVSPW